MCIRDSGYSVAPLSVAPLSVAPLSAPLSSVGSISSTAAQYGSWGSSYLNSTGVYGGYSDGFIGGYTDIGYSDIGYDGGIGYGDIGYSDIGYSDVGFGQSFPSFDPVYNETSFGIPSYDSGFIDGGFQGGFPIESGIPFDSAPGIIDQGFGVPLGSDFGTPIGDTQFGAPFGGCLLYTSPSPRDATLSRMPSSA